MDKDIFLKKLKEVEDKISVMNSKIKDLTDVYILSNRKFFPGDRVHAGDSRVFEVVDVYGYDSIGDVIVYNSFLVSNSGEITKRAKRICENVMKKL